MRLASLSGLQTYSVSCPNNGKSLSWINRAQSKVLVTLNLLYFGDVQIATAQDVLAPTARSIPAQGEAAGGTLGMPCQLLGGLKARSINA